MICGLEYFLRKIWKGRGTRGRSALQRAFDAASTAPPVSAQTDNGFFPLSRWVFYAELISEALSRNKIVAGGTDLEVVGDWATRGAEETETDTSVN